MVYQYGCDKLLRALGHRCDIQTMVDCQRAYRRDVLTIAIYFAVMTVVINV